MIEHTEGAARAKPTHYKVICISFYTDDLIDLDAVVKRLKRLGHTKASRSAVLREAMRRFDIDAVAKEWGR